MLTTYHKQSSIKNVNAKKQTIFPGSKFRKILFALCLILSFDILISGRSAGIGLHTYTHATYYLYALFAIPAFLCGAHRIISRRAQIAIMAAMFITSHLLCSLEETTLSDQPTLTQPTPRLFAPSCWIALNPTSGLLEAGD
ncbi:hypothetical protein AC781_07075 [Akkermansia glycaniphila]|nr:hypothetical protein AC781_07075 [Akkermansia glycaniphila]